MKQVLLVLTLLMAIATSAFAMGSRASVKPQPACVAAEFPCWQAASDLCWKPNIESKMNPTTGQVTQEDWNNYNVCFDTAKKVCMASRGC